MVLSSSQKGKPKGSLLRQLLAHLVVIDLLEIESKSGEKIVVSPKKAVCEL